VAVGHFSSSNYGVEKAAPPAREGGWTAAPPGGEGCWRTDRGSQTLMERGRCSGMACFNGI